MHKGPIGVFDSGFGGLTVLRAFTRALPNNDFIYLGDNARAPYGNRSFETINDLTLGGVTYLFDQGCPLVILACNTASAKALRNIQQLHLPRLNPENRVLGVIRPTTEAAGEWTRSGHVGILATPGTVLSDSYVIEMAKFFPETVVHQKPCPMWVALVENGELDGEGAEYFVQRDLEQLLRQDPEIDCIILACTHFPFLRRIIEKFLPGNIRLVDQTDLVATKLKDYLKRHREIASRCSLKGQVRFLTSESSDFFNAKAGQFLDREVNARQVVF